MKRVGLFLLLSLIIAVPAAEPPVANATPSPRSTTPERDYPAGRQVALLRAATVADDPANGLLIRAVAVGSAGERAGLRAGEVIVATDGSRTSVPWKELTPGPHSLTVWSMDDGESVHVVDGPPPFGLVVIPTRTRDAVDLDRWRGEPGTWAEDLIAAAAWLSERPEFAESALAHAYAAGYRGHLLRTMGAVLAAQRGAYDDALALGVAALKDCPAPERAALASALITAAIATGRPTLMKSIASQAPAAASAFDLSDLPQCGTEAERADASWVLEAPTTDLTHRLELVAGANTSEQAIASIRSTGSFELSAPRDVTAGYRFGPARADVELALKYRICAAPGAGEHEPTARFALRGADDAPGKSLLQLEVCPEGAMSISADDKRTRLRLVAEGADFQVLHELRLTAYGLNIPHAAARW